MRTFACIAFAAIAALSALAIEPSLASAERRMALVIGNSAYRHASRLPNPTNDAADVASALKRIGFEVIVGVDLDRIAMDEAVIKFARVARGSDIALFYYAGHAMQFGGVNYLLPIDVKLTDEADLRRLTKVDDIVRDLRQAKLLRILVLDSCRDNPLAEELTRSVGTTRGASVGRGLARIDAVDGTIISFATQSGRTADDGRGRNSPYTSAFLRHIESQEEIGTIFRSVSDDVFRSTQRSQLPELSLSIVGRFYLNGQITISVKPPAPQPQVAPPDPAERAWNAVKDTSSIAIIEEFLRQYGNSMFAVFARARLEELKKSRMAAAATPAPAPPDTRPAPTPDKSCGIERSLKSIEGNIATSIIIRNDSSIVAQLYWIDYSGKRILYNRLGPGQTLSQPTYLTHPWVITDAANNCLAIYRPENKPREFVLR